MVERVKQTTVYLFFGKTTTIRYKEQTNTCTFYTYSDLQRDVNFFLCMGRLVSFPVLDTYICVATKWQRNMAAPICGTDGGHFPRTGHTQLCGHWSPNDIITWLPPYAVQMAAIFPVLDTYSCVATKWTRHMGFCITYSALLLKTWR